MDYTENKRYIITMKGHSCEGLEFSTKGALQTKKTVRYGWVGWTPFEINIRHLKEVK